MLTVRQALAMEVFAGSCVVAGKDGLDREIRWAHPVDIPHASEWVRGGELLLTTFYGLRDDPEAQIHLCAELAEKGLAGMVVAIGGYLDAVPDAIRSAADAARFPIIEMPWDVPFEDVVRAISEQIINEQYQLYKQSLSIHGSLTRLVLDGGSLQDVAQELCKLLQRPVEIDDLSFSMLAAAGSETEIDDSRRTALREGRSAPMLLEHLRRTGVLSRMRASFAPERIDADESTSAYGMTMARILAPIVVARKIYGYVWIIAGRRELEPLDFHAIEHAATVAALILFRDQTGRQAEERAESRILSRLLAEDARLDNTLREEAARFRLRLEAPHAILVIDAGSNEVRAVELAARNAVRRAGLAAAMGERAGRVVVLVEGSRAEAIVELCQRIITEAQPLEDTIRVGASPLHEDAATLQRAYEHALEALALLPALGDDRKVAQFDELGILHWLHAVPQDLLAENAFARSIQRLAEHDRARGAELLHTLEVFLECDGNSVRAAERLIVHRHTLKYRLQRIEELCEVDVSDPLCKLNLRAALLSRRMRNAHGGE
ncbi:MAG TPA: PucR family transcriptional regulator ligand-binding domain-containing protein [Ktedonobacterales bacterium]|nr:PucR family transcriptional regulator ligand-binding domain-containing protein [Ktedonobacterales bacterium]